MFLVLVRMSQKIGEVLRCVHVLGVERFGKHRKHLIDVFVGVPHKQHRKVDFWNNPRTTQERQILEHGPSLHRTTIVALQVQLLWHFWKFQENSSDHLAVEICIWRSDLRVGEVDEALKPMHHNADHVDLELEFGDGVFGWIEYMGKGCLSLIEAVDD